MTPASFDYFSPTSIDEALNLLEKHGDDAKILAGGQSLIPLMKLRFTSFPYIVDLSRIPDLRLLEEREGILKIGAMTTNAEVQESDLIKRKYTILNDATSHIADPLVRNMGTVGGNLSHGDPGNDLPAVMMAMKAKYHLRSGKGSRTVEATQFYKDTFVTAAEPGEILTDVEIDTRKRPFGAYVKHKRRSGDFSVAGVAIAFGTKEDGSLSDVGVGLTSVGPTAIHAAKTESWLEGKLPGEKTIARAVEIVVSEAEPLTDFYGTEAYKKFTLGVLMKKSLKQALERGKGGE